MIHRRICNLTYAIKVIKKEQDSFDLEIKRGSNVDNAQGLREQRSRWVEPKV